MEVAVKGKVKRRHLNAADCEELGQSAEGTGALTQPHAVTQRRDNHFLNRRLHPRTPSKRRKCASASGSPCPKQRGISDFFSVTGVLSSSPNKSSQPSMSTNSPVPRLQLFPKDEPQVVREEEEEEEDSDDDVSLLAVALAAEQEEEEVDDMNLLAAEMMQDSRTEQREEVEGEEMADYLEGMTAEMFGDDDDFELCEGGAGDEEVEPLPDAHYGLLGGSDTLLQPQGCIEDLPEEVLRQVLCLVPAQDLYRNVSLVCQRWRDIVQDPKFVPFKKLYYRYMMRERTSEQQVFNTLKDSGITDPAAVDHSIRRLVVLMSKHKAGQRVRPDDLLACVKKHRLFPQAEASIRLHIPDVQKCLRDDVEAPYAYGAMAIILLLSEGVPDVQALVWALRGCLSLSAVTEFLSHAATMLLALMRSNAPISNRVHYNIYYVLHLMENGPFAVSSLHSRRPQILLTHEQQQILSHDVERDHIVKIVAFAGTGKTTTLVKYAEQRPHLRFLYVAFNKSVALEAQRRFPRNVTCKTVHSLAYQDVGKNHGKLAFCLNAFTINAVLPKGRGGYSKAKVVANTLNAFMTSTEPTVGLVHVPSTRVNKEGVKVLISEADRQQFMWDAQRIWRRMTESKRPSVSTHAMTHDGYLKLWQLKVPRPQLSDQYDVIFIDEAQDCNPATLDVLLSQRCGKILVGDPHQQIYTFRGAVNALHMVEHTHVYYLTQSFRFGAEIAYVAATILNVCKSVQKILVGGKQKGGLWDEAADAARLAARTGAVQHRGKVAILSRSNHGVFNEAVSLSTANPLCRIHFIGGTEGIGLDRIMDIWQLWQRSLRRPGQDQDQEQDQDTTFLKDTFLRGFAKRSLKPFLALRMYVKQAEDKELEGKLATVEKYGRRLPGLVEVLRRCSEPDMNRADFILGTVHKAKGLEFDTVLICNDFAGVPSSRHNLHFSPKFSFANIPDDEWNLLYVAVTRAKTSLIVTKSIRRILTMAGEYFLRSEMPGPPLKAGEPLPCVIQDCPNCVTAGSAFVMSKREMICTDGDCAGGPLCERCVWARVGPTAFLVTQDVHSMAQIQRWFAPEIPNIFLGLI